MEVGKRALPLSFLEEIITDEGYQSLLYCDKLAARIREAPPRAALVEFKRMACVFKAAQDHPENGIIQRIDVRKALWRHRLMACDIYLDHIQKHVQLRDTGLSYLDTLFYYYVSRRIVSGLLARCERKRKLHVA